MIYDAADGYEVYFGGQYYSNTFDSTWIFSNGLWTNITATAGTPPSSRTGMSMTYDASDGYVLAFGGTAGGNTCNGQAGCNDTWEFLGGHWTLLHPTVNPLCSPGCASLPTESNPITYDAADGYVVMFTGSPFVPSPETWEFHADKWTQLAGATPPLTAGEQLVYDTALHEAILFGGVVPGSGGWFEYNFTWAWSHGAWANISGSLRVSPSGRDSYGLVYDSSSSELVLFGGARTTHLLNDTWTFGTGGWTNVTSQVAPQPRVEVAMADDPANGTILLFGGQNVTTTAWGLGDTWAWSGVTDNWSLVYGSLSVSSLRASSNPAIFGAPVNFTSTVSGGTPPYTYAWAFGDGATGGDLPNITHAYTTNGPFRVILAVTDAVGDTARGYINVTILLQAQVQASVTSGAPPLAVRFGGTAVGGAPPYAFTWDFGDGSPVSHSEDTAHTYNGSGVYTVVLTVRDSQGEEATHTLEVKTSGAGFLGLPNGEGYYLVGALIVAVLAVSLFAGRRVISARATEAAERGKGDAFREYRESLNIRDEGPVDTLAPGQTDPAEDIF